ncbi:hypothetical protein [Paramagnetospirillum magneticum]|uniref:Uncharacterized protein n=1 Tax=Paramagnetospirillum magneticum (strain ATCC 700264 / AMB-1) TaxID=342108 RepID=Q2W6D8_PARM1|nr:hypothetical protein [Paramagnetospirillum magneticum]BAE50587.1 hypothetical protein amb1783 [Paramagnetospirillum magneticum AMB-1]
MAQWLTDLIAILQDEYAAQDIAWIEVGWDTKRRRLIAIRWPAGAQSEAMQDHLNGRIEADGGKWERMQAEIAAIKAAIPKE